MSVIGRHRMLAPAGEGPAADVTMLIGVVGVLALDLVRTDPGARAPFDARLAAD